MPAWNRSFGTIRWAFSMASIIASRSDANFERLSRQKADDLKRSRVNHQSESDQSGPMICREPKAARGFNRQFFSVLKKKIPTVKVGICVFT
jgi:hypothetical protein